MITLRVNGEEKTFDAPPDMPLLWVLRDILGLTGTKFGCGIAQCGACTIQLDRRPVRSCLPPVSTVGDRSITIIEGISRTEVGRRVQKAWLDAEVVQCRYCQSGQIMSAAASNSDPSDAEIDMAMAGNVCRCAPYVWIRNPIKQAATGNPIGMQTLDTAQVAASDATTATRSR
jgi:isoquinoline 1-oxidoreductase subunit alpha